MAQLTAGTVRNYEFNEDPALTDLPMLTAVAAYKGSALGKSSGYARQLVAADVFLGFAEEDSDNTAGASGAKTIKARQKGFVQLSVVGVTAVTDQGATVYASDGNTFTLTSTSNTAIGKVARWVSGTTVIVYFEAAALQSI
jgi:hypothetical protein